MPFLPADDGLVAGAPMACASETAAIRHAEAMSCRENTAGAVAFSRRGEPDLGELEDAVILKTFGQVPEDFGRG
jgi:hypothetical protein